MPVISIDVIPPARWPAAIDVLVAPLAEDVRQGQRQAIREMLTCEPSQAAGFLGHFCGGELTSVCWLQRHPGRTATLWPPVSAGPHNRAVPAALIARSLEVARSQNVALVQSLLLTDAAHDAQTLTDAGFSHIADLLYLVSLAGQFPSVCPTDRLTLSPCCDADGQRIGRLIEQSYHGTRDCPALNHVRAIDDVLAGYRAVGGYRPDLWLVASISAGDAGCLLLADHSPQRVWELVYLGVLPEWRGRGLGLEMTRFAQWLAWREHIERLVLAVDADNEPALAMYAAAGFVAWDRRSVFVQVLPAGPSELHR